VQPIGTNIRGGTLPAFLFDRRPYLSAPFSSHAIHFATVSVIKHVFRDPNFSNQILRKADLLTSFTCCPIKT